jgi:hypothetical protein
MKSTALLTRLRRKRRRTIINRTKIDIIAPMLAPIAVEEELEDPAAVVVTAVVVISPVEYERINQNNVYKRSSQSFLKALYSRLALLHWHVAEF